MDTRQIPQYKVYFMPMESPIRERREKDPDTETVAAREALKKGLSVLLKSSFRVDLHKVLESKSSVAVILDFDDDTRQVLPNALTQFVHERFHGRSVGINQIQVVDYRIGSRWEHDRKISTGRPTGYIYISVINLYPRSPEKAEPELQRVVVDRDEVTGMSVTEKVAVLERQKDFKYTILPQLNMAVVNHVSLYPFETPMEWRMASYPLESLLEKGERLEKISDPLKTQLDPHGLGLFEDIRKTSSRGMPDVFKGPLQPVIVDMIAGLLPDPPKTSPTYLQQPKKWITIR